MNLKSIALFQKARIQGSSITLEYNSIPQLTVDENGVTFHGQVNGSIGGLSPWTEVNDDLYYVSGRVGIGTSAYPTDPNYKLAIGGKAIMEEVKVQLQSSWPDYVFQDGYEVPSLADTKKFIEENNHLPEIPSAREVEEAGGIELGEMNVLLLKKIEELTLLLIEKDGEIKALLEQSKRISQLELEIQEIKEMIKNQ